MRLPKSVQRFFGLTAAQESVLMGDFFGSTSSVAVTQDSVLALSAFWGCVRYISTQVGVMPWGVYRSEGGKREEQRKHWAWSTLHERPSLYHSPSELKQSLIWNALVLGNGYAERVNGTNLYMMDPTCTTPMLVEGRRLIYRYMDPLTHTERWLLPNDVLHVKGPSRDGVTGLSVIAFARETLSSGLELQAFTNGFFSNGTHVGGVYQTETTLKEEAYERLKQSLASERGSKQSHKPRILEGGLKYVADTIPPQDAQFLEQRKFSAREVCALFGVAPHKIGLEEGATAYASREEANTEVVVDCLTFWVTRLEEEADWKLLTYAERRDGLYTHMNMDALLRGNAKSRAEAFQIRMRNGTLTPDEWRAKEEDGPIPGGDQAMITRDLIPLDKAGEYADSQMKPDPAPAGAEPDPADALEPVVENAKRVIAARHADDDKRGRPHDPAFAEKVWAPVREAAARLGVEIGDVS